MENRKEISCPQSAAELPESREFKMGGMQFAAEMMFRYGAIWIAALFILALAGVTLGFALDWRWIIIGLMIVFIVIPMAMTFLYYNYGLRKECYVNTLNHNLIIKDDGLVFKVRFPAYEKKSDNDKNLDDNQLNNNKLNDNQLGSNEFATDILSRKNKGQDVINPDVKGETREYEFSYSELLPYTVGSKSVTLKFKDGRKGFLWIPCDAYEDPNEMAKVLRFIDSKTEK